MRSVSDCLRSDVSSDFVSLFGYISQAEFKSEDFHKALLSVFFPRVAKHNFRKFGEETRNG